MNKQQIKREIKQNLQDIEDSLSEIENIIEETDDVELYDISIEWIEKIHDAIDIKSERTFTYIDSL